MLFPIILYIIKWGGGVCSAHNYEIDLSLFEFIRDNYKVEIFNLCPKSLFSSKHFPLAPCLDSHFNVENKQEGFIKDFIIPEPYVYKKYRKFVYRPYLREKNICYKFCEHFIRFPSLLKHYFLKIKQERLKKDKIL